MTRPPSHHRPMRSTVLAVAVGCAALSGTVAAAATARRPTPAPEPTDDAIRPTLTAADIPEEAFVPLQEGDASVASFRSFVDRQVVDHYGHPRPGPAELTALGDAVDAVAHGTIAGAALVQHPITLGGLTAARIELQLLLGPTSTTLRGDAAPGEVWHVPVWMGDPAFAPAVLSMLETELGTGPVGADAVLFATDVDDASPFGGGLTVVDGIVQGGPEVARLSRDPAPAPTELTNVQRALEAAGS